jgi:hypothetical protein
MTRFLTVAGISVLLLTSCSNKDATPAGERPRATVLMRDGTTVGGTVVDSSATEIKIAGDDRVTRAIPMSQVKSVEYGDTPAAAEPAQAQTSPAPAAPPARSQASRPVPQPRPASASRVEPNGTVETHEHPVESEITSRTYVLPVGTQLSVRNEETIDSGKAAEGQTFAAEVTEDVRDADGATVIPRGANAQIVITSASQGGRITGASDLVLDLKSVAIDGREYRLSTEGIQQRGKSGVGANKRTAEYSGGGAALGAIIGAIAGGGKGAAIGAGAGAGGGALTQVLTKGGAIRVPVETVLTFKLDKPLKVVAAR